MHFIIKCPLLQSPRASFFNKLKEIVPSFSNMSDNDKVMFILGENDIDICEICIAGIYEMYKLNTSLKE